MYYSASGASAHRTEETFFPSHLAGPLLRQPAEECYLRLVQAFFCCPFMFMLGNVNGSLNYNLLDL